MKPTKAHPLFGRFYRKLPDGRTAYITEATYGKGRINVSSPGCDLSIDIAY